MKITKTARFAVPHLLFTLGPNHQSQGLASFLKGTFDESFNWKPH